MSVSKLIRLWQWRRKNVDRPCWFFSTIISNDLLVILYIWPVARRGGRLNRYDYYYQILECKYYLWICRGKPGETARVESIHFQNFSIKHRSLIHFCVSIFNWSMFCTYNVRSPFVQRDFSQMCFVCGLLFFLLSMSLKFQINNFNRFFTTKKKPNKN